MLAVFHPGTAGVPGLPVLQFDNVIYQAHPVKENYKHTYKQTYKQQQKTQKKNPNPKNQNPHILSTLGFSVGPYSGCAYLWLDTPMPLTDG